MPKGPLLPCEHLATVGRQLICGKSSRDFPDAMYLFLAITVSRAAGPRPLCRGYFQA